MDSIPIGRDCAIQDASTEDSDPVRRLRAKAVSAKTEAELSAVFPQLHAAIRDRIHRLRLIAAKEIRARRTDSRAA